MPILTSIATKDAYSYAGGAYQASENILQFGNAAGQDAHTAIEFPDIQVSQGGVVNAATFTLEMTVAASVNSNYDQRLLSAINPTFPLDAAAMRTTAATTAIGTHVILTTASNGVRTYNIAPALQEQVNKPGWVKGGSIVVIIRKAPALTGGRTTHKSIEGGFAPTLTVDFTPPATFTGSGTASGPSQTASGSGTTDNPPATGTTSLAAPDQTAAGTGDTTNPEVVGSGTMTAPEGSVSGTGQTEGEPAFAGEGDVTAPEQTAAGEGSSDNPGVSGGGVVAAPGQAATGKAHLPLAPATRRAAYRQPAVRTDQRGRPAYARPAAAGTQT